MINCTFENGDRVPLRHVTVDAIVTKGNKILLVKRSAKIPEGGKWGVPGGFMERDETTAQAIAREILEETGWQVKNLTLLRINDNPNRRGEDRQNVDFVYFCEAVEQTGEPDWETDEVRWFDWDDLPGPDEIAFDHLENIKLYQEYIQNKVQLPFVGQLK